MSLGGLALIDGARRADTTLQVVHAAPGGISREFYRAIVDDDAVGVFQGKIIVEQAAQKTDGAMKSQAILLSPRAQMNEKPELEIFADDVVCGHGATVASLDPEQVFYLQSRGIPTADAKAMLLEAFRAESPSTASRMKCWLSRCAPGSTPGSGRAGSRRRRHEQFRAIRRSTPMTLKRYARISRSSPSARTGSRLSIWTTRLPLRSRRRSLTG